MKSWNTPDDYIEECIQWHCSSDTREAVGCTEKFYELGYFDMSRGGWDLYAEYQTLCKTCPHYTHDISLYWCKNNPNVHVQVHLHSLQITNLMVE